MGTNITDNTMDHSVVSGASERETVLEVTDLCVSYDKVQALRGVDITVEDGQMISLVGPNGAGKTTFANTISGFLEYEGSIRHRGQELAAVSQMDIVHRGVIQCTEKRNLFGYLDVEDNLELGGYLQEKSAIKEQKKFVYDLFSKLKERRHQNVQSMSGGEQQMLAIGRSLMSKPDLLILDEPTLGLAPVILQDIAEVIDSILDQGVSILLAEQNVTFALDHADHIYLLENGEVVHEGAPTELKKDDYIRKSYLG